MIIIMLAHQFVRCVPVRHCHIKRRRDQVTVNAGLGKFKHKWRVCLFIDLCSREKGYGVLVARSIKAVALVILLYFHRTTAAEVVFRRIIRVIIYREINDTDSNDQPKAYCCRHHYLMFDLSL